MISTYQYKEYIMTVNNNSKKIEQLQKIVSDLTDEIFLIKTHMANFKAAVEEDFRKFLQEEKNNGK